jgi:hypothetical protein
LGILPISEKYQVGDWSLPGHGVAYSDCGDLKFRGCLNVSEHSSLDSSISGKAYVEGYYRSCNRKECPTCYETWASLEASRAEYRLLSFCQSKALVREVFSISDDDRRYKYVERAFRSARRKPIHVIYSIPKRLWGWDITKLRPSLYKIAKDTGLYGGCSIFHPFRENAQTKKWYFSPHFHIVGFGWIRRVKSLYEATGWIIKNAGVRKTVHGTLLYQLSHAGVNAKRHVVTWFGALSYNKLRVDPRPVVKPVCPLCESELVCLLFVGGLDRPPPDEEGKFYLEVRDWVEKTPWRGVF